MKNARHLAEAPAPSLTVGFLPQGVGERKLQLIEEPPLVGYFSQPI